MAGRVGVSGLEVWPVGWVCQDYRCGRSGGCVRTTGVAGVAGASVLCPHNGWHRDAVLCPHNGWHRDAVLFHESMPLMRPTVPNTRGGRPANTQGGRPANT